VLGLQALAGNRAVTRLLARAEDDTPRPPRTPGDIVRDLEAVGAEINRVRGVANDLLEERGERRPGTLQETIDRLRDLAAKGDERAGRLAGELEGLVERRDGLLGELGRAVGHRPPTPESGPGRESFDAPHEGKTPSEEPRGAGTAVEAAAEAEEALIDRIGSRVGSVAEGLLPTPLDALIMEGQYAGAYEDAWEAIEERNTRGGITFGITAGIMDLDWAWVRDNLARRRADRDFNTEMAGAVGKAESAFNDGLRRGHAYGFGHPPSLKRKILARAFQALAQRGIQVPEGERRSFDTLTRVAGVLTPVVDDFYAKVAERRKAREEADRQRRKVLHMRPY
jgi:hypothetical protein